MMRYAGGDEIAAIVAVAAVIRPALVGVVGEIIHAIVLALGFGVGGVEVIDAVAAGDRVKPFAAHDVIVAVAAVEAVVAGFAHHGVVVVAAIEAVIAGAAAHAVVAVIAAH